MIWTSVAGALHRSFRTLPFLGTFKQGVSKQGVMTFAWRLGSQYDVAATRGADSVLASDCRAQFGLPSTERGCRICVTQTVWLPVRPRGETMYWQANANTPLSITLLLNVPDFLSPTPLSLCRSFQLLHSNMLPNDLAKRFMRPNEPQAIEQRSYH